MVVFHDGPGVVVVEESSLMIQDLIAEDETGSTALFHFRISCLLFHTLMKLTEIFSITCKSDIKPLRDEWR